jgi:hypothetical protein
MHRLSGHLVAHDHVGHGRPVKHFIHRLQPLLHQSQLHQNLRPPSHLDSQQRSWLEARRGPLDRSEVSSWYRSRVRKASTRAEQGPDLRFRVEAMGLEPTNLLTASQALYQLSYAPERSRQVSSR